jgi:hypothetical protein
MSTKELVDILRDLSKKNKGKKVLLPTESEPFGFVSGEQDVETLLHFLADMLEE